MCGLQRNLDKLLGGAGLTIVGGYDDLELCVLNGVGAPEASIAVLPFPLHEKPLQGVTALLRTNDEGIPENFFAWEFAELAARSVSADDRAKFEAEKASRAAQEEALAEARAAAGAEEDDDESDGEDAYDSDDAERDDVSSEEEEEEEDGEDESASGSEGEEVDEQGAQQIAVRVVGVQRGNAAFPIASIYPPILPCLRVCNGRL